MPIRKKTKVDKLIELHLDSMENHEPGSDEYENRLKVVERLTKLKASGQQRVSWDTIISTLGSLIGILIVVLHERSHVITTKAFNIFGKSR